MRSSVVGGSVAIDLEEELADLAPDENIFEVHLASAALDEDALGKNPPTFLSLDFFEHETQATPVVSSSAPEYDHTIQVRTCCLPTRLPRNFPWPCAQNAS